MLTAHPAIRAVARMLFPSTSIPRMSARFSMLSLFILNIMRERSDRTAFTGALKPRLVYAPDTIPRRASMLRFVALGAGQSREDHDAERASRTRKEANLGEEAAIRSPRHPDEPA